MLYHFYRNLIFTQVSQDIASGDLSSNRILELCSMRYGRIAHRAIALTACQP